MSTRSRVLVFEFLLAILVLSTSANKNPKTSNRYTYGEILVEEQETIKCQMGNACEAYCVEQNKTSAVEGSVLNDTRCVSSGYHLHFVFSKKNILRPGWFVNNAIIKTVIIRDAASIVEIEPGAFDDCTFRYVTSLELRGTAITYLRKGALAGLNNLKTLSLYANNEMSGIEENALEGLFQLEEFVMEGQKQLSNLGNITEKIEWKYLQSLSLSNNSFPSTIKKPTFKGCIQLQKLNLSNSEIEAIGPHSFESIEETIKVIDLRNNRLKSLPSGLIENLIRKSVEFYLSSNLWDCDCASSELQGYEINDSSLIRDSPLICETPRDEKGNLMKDVLIACYSTTSATYPDSTTPIYELPVNLDHLSCSDETDLHHAGIAVEMEYQFFNIKQEEAGKISIEINYPDASLALVYIDDHDYKARCQYNLKRSMKFDSLNTNAGHLFCLIKKSSYTTSPRNCLPFYFAETNFIWGRDRIVLTLVCSFGLASVLGIIIGWVLICRYRRSVKSKSVLRHGSRDSKAKIISDDFNSWSRYNQKKFFMNPYNTGAILRRSCSENSLASHKTYLTPSPMIEAMQRRYGNTIENSNDYNMRRYIDRLPYDILPPPLPPQNGRKERIYETIMDPPFNGEIVYLQRKY